MAVCHPQLKLSCDILEKGYSGGTVKADSGGPGNKGCRNPKDQLSPFPASSGCAQLCLCQDAGVGGGVRQRCARQSNPAIKKAAALACLKTNAS